MSKRSPEALAAALAMLRRPQLAKLAQRSTLPRGMLLLLEVAAGEPNALGEAQALTGRPEDLLRKAAGFFMEQVLLSRKNDSYRILGLSSSASATELRRHMALILKWLHPDLLTDSLGGHQLDKGALARLVISAWQTLKTPARRAAYDASLTIAAKIPNYGPVRSAQINSPCSPSGQLRTRRTRRRQFTLYRLERESLWHRLLLYLRLS